VETLRVGSTLVEPARVNGGWIRGSVLRPRTNFLLVAVNKPLTFFESAPFPGGFESGVPRKWVMRHDIRLPSGSNIFWAEHPRHGQRISRSYLRRYGSSRRPYRGPRAVGWVG
jgi:hypothetical protein